MFKHVPNILTILRILLIPIILVFIFSGNYILGFVFFTISGITDILDGFIARKFNFISNIGKLLDPLADKLTQIAVLASLTITHIIPVWILAIVIFKELIMVVGASFLYGKSVVVYSKWYGKLATVLFYISIVISLITKQFNIIGFWVNVSLALYCIALFATIFSLVMYSKALYQNGVINKNDLKKDTRNLIIKGKKTLNK